MNNKEKILNLSLNRLYRLGDLRDQFTDKRFNLPSNIWLTISKDWSIAYQDNNDTKEEMMERFAI